MKNKLWKKLSAGFLAVALATTMLPATALASEVPLESEAETVETDELEGSAAEDIGAEDVGADADEVVEATEDEDMEADEKEETAEEADAEEILSAEDSADVLLDEEEGETEAEESYRLNVDYITDGTNCVLVGDTTEVVVSVAHDWRDEDGEYQYEDIYSFNYVIGDDLNEEMLSYEEEWDDDGLHLTFTGLGIGEDGNTSFIFYAIVDDEIIAEEEVWIYVTEDGYHYLSMPDAIETIALEEDFDLSDYEDQITLCYKDAKGVEEVDSNEYTLLLAHPDDNAWESTDETSLTGRLTVDGTGVDVMACVPVEGEEAGEDNVVAWGYIWFDDIYSYYEDAVALSYSGKYDYQYGDEDWHYVIDEADLTVTLTVNEESEVTLPEGYTFEWNFWDEAYDNGYITYDVNGDGSSVTITVDDEAMLTDGTYDSYFGISAEVYYDGNCICSAWDWMDVLVSYENYEMMDDQTVVADEVVWIGNSMYCDYRDAECPGGDGTDVSITNVEILSQEPVDADAEGGVIELDQYEDEDGITYYWLYAVNYGTAEVEVTYLTLDGEEATYTFTVNVVGSYYSMDIWATDGENTDNLLVGAARTYEAVLYYIWNDEDGEYNEAAYGVEDFVDGSEYYLVAEYDDDYVDVSITDGYIEVTGIGEGDTDVTVLVYNSENEPVAEISFHVYVTTDGYYTINGNAEQIALGNTIELSGLDYIVTYYYIDENGEAQSEPVDLNDGGYRVRLDTDTVDWSAWAYANETSEEDLLPTLERIGNWYTDFHLILDRYNEESGEWEEWIADFWLGFDEISYDTGFEAYFDGEISYYYLYIDQTAAFELYASDDNEYDLPEGYTVDWTLAYYVYDEEAEEYVWTEVEEDSEIFGWKVEDNILYVTPGEEAAGEDLIIYATVCYEGNEISYTDEGWYYCIEEVTEGYAQMESERILPGESITAAGYICEYSTLYPNGYITDGVVTKVEVSEPYPDTEGETVVTVGEDGLTVTGVSDGYVYLTVTCEDEDGNEYSFEGTYLEVVSDFYYLNLEEDYEYEICGPGEETEIEVILYHAYVDNGNAVREVTSYSDLSFTRYYYDDEGELVPWVTYDENIISPVWDNSTTVTVTGVSEGEDWFEIIIYDENGDYIASEWVSVTVYEGHSYEAVAGDHRTTWTCSVCGDSYITGDTGVLKSSDGNWYYYVNGVIQKGYYGFQSNDYGIWYIEHGQVTFTANSVIQDKEGTIGDVDAWWYVVGSEVKTDYTGVANYKNDYGWWYIKNGKVDFSANTVASNNHGWWYVVGGKVRFDYTGVANYKNDSGWWYIKNGKVDFSANTVASNKYGWWYVGGGKVQFDYTGVANYKNSSGWWYIKGGKVDFTFTGRAANKYGTWNVVNGKVKF